MLMDDHDDLCTEQRAPMTLPAFSQSKQCRCGLCFVFLLLIFAVVCVEQAKIATGAVVSNEDARLLEVGRAAKLRFTPAEASSLPAEIKIVSYNMRWRGGSELRELITLLQTDPEIGGAGIIGLQEVDRYRKRSGNIDTARMMAEALGMHYAWAAPPHPPQEQSKQSEDETGVAILSFYPMTDIERLVLPSPGPGGRRRVALGATVQIGERSVRVYSLHGETRISNDKRLEQQHCVLAALARRPQVERAVVLGDFNTIGEGAERKTIELFAKANFHTPIPHNQSTWKTFILKFKLDWLWLRYLQPTDSGIAEHIKLSDHWPLWVNVKL